ncbi:hypothetical protein BZA05DRAFT_409538 [Tricharina praecox]|uniref:uncharacterized protein n=1 Tax=Tricharina praecox TaxID=43433 RepID=UPI00221FC350|nr:uncharacterized protein BZA05DRAFT_409538 [Tricharina praecox]KAI5844254.1 hypothetical protein BZA05DRAFT_409538 [Tricharina praecox]
MATRRNVKAEQPVPSTSEKAPEALIATKQPASLNVPGSVVAKLLLFTFAMITAPLGTYYISVTSLFVGQSTVAGALAAVAANVVLIAYVIVAMTEDAAEGEDKKSQ